jgi:hypothetical protein
VGCAYTPTGQLILERHELRYFCRFLVARLLVDALRDAETENEVRTFLEPLLPGADIWNEVYKKVLDGLLGQKEPKRMRALRTPAWVTYAVRPLELRHALAVVPARRSFNPRDLPDIESLLIVCKGLLEISYTGVRFLHYTTQKYLEQKLPEIYPDGQLEIAKACLTYISYDKVKSTGPYSGFEGDELWRWPAFTPYTVTQWAEHVRPLQIELEENAMAFLGDDELTSCISSLAYAYYKWRDDYPPSGRTSMLKMPATGPSGATGLDLAAWYGLENLLCILLKASHTYTNPIRIGDQTRKLSYAPYVGRPWPTRTFRCNTPRVWRRS